VFAAAATQLLVDGGDEAQERVGVDRLDQVHVEAGADGAIALIVAAVAGERDQIERAPRVIDRRANSLRDFVAVEARQPDIDNREVMRAGERAFDAGEAVARDFDFVAGDRGWRAARSARGALPLVAGSAVVPLETLLRKSSPSCVS
jgi:hypothetical protein